MINFYRILSESPNILKISLMLDEIGLPYTVKMVESHSLEDADAEFLEVSPNGTLPAIHDSDNGVSLFESGAILYYLAEKTGKLLPSNLEQRAEVIKWLMFEASNVCPAMIELHHYIMNDMGDIPEVIFQRYRNKIAQYCSILDKQLTKHEFLSGDFSIADLALYPWAVTFEDMAEIDPGDYPNLQNWASVIGERVSIREG